MTAIKSLSVAACLSLTVPVAIAASGPEDKGSDWPQWRGPLRTGASPETEWSPVAKAQSLWSKSLGFGHSSFAVADGRLFAMGYDLDRKLDVVYCLDPQTGQERWTHTYPAEYWNEGHDGGTCATPTVSGNIVYTCDREGVAFALNAATGSVLWTHDVKSLLGVAPPRWGFSGSPVVLGDEVVLNVDKIAAFDKATGELKWSTEKTYGNAYSTPVDYDYNGRPSVLVLNGEGLAVIDQADGSEITFFPWTRNPEQAVYGATPVIVDGRIFISGAAGGGCVMLQPGENGLDVVWQNAVMRSSYAGCVLYENHLYGFDQHVLKCLDLDGNELWRQRGIGLGAMIVIGDRLLIVSAKGELIVAEANPERYVELSREKVLDGGTFWATPVLSHGLAYARNSLGDMVCVDYRRDAASGGASPARKAAPAVLPDAAAILDRHVQAMGGADALRKLDSVVMTGRGERHGGGPVVPSDATLAWAADGSFVWRFDSGFELGFNPRLGWSLSQQGASVLEQKVIDNLREAGDLHRVLTPGWGYQSVKTVETRVFDDRQCYVVAATKPDGAERTLYFEVSTGLLAGQEGEDISLWVYGDYREPAGRGGVKLPMAWSFFAPGSGSMTAATISSVAINSAEAAVFEPPLLVRMKTRSPEEMEAANQALRAKYTDIAGNYKLTTGSMVGTPINIMIQEGGIQLSFGGEPADYITEPDKQGRLFLMTDREIYVQFDRDAAGAITKMRVFAYGSEFGEMEHVAGE